MLLPDISAELLQSKDEEAKSKKKNKIKSARSTKKIKNKNKKPHLSYLDRVTM